MALPWTATARTAPPPPATGWYPVARSAEVGTAPVPVAAGGQPYVVVRLRPGAEVTAVSARCPHRPVPMAAATVVDGRLRCAYHGWQFNAEGRCVDIPSLGPDGVAPPQADLAVPWAVEERDGWVWLAPERTSTHRPPRLGGSTPRPEPVPPAPGPAGPVLGNLDPSLERAWHPVALAGELRDGGYAQIRLLGRSWTLHRDGGTLSAAPPAWGVVERLGVVWLAPAEPDDVPLEVPEASDARTAAAWLPPARSSAPAGILADAFLTGARSPFGPAGTPAAVVERQPGGFTGVGGPATAVVRVPFQLLVRVADGEGGAARTVVVLLQPEDADSTRIYTLLLLRDAGPAALADELAAVREAIAEDLELLALVGGGGLPLLTRDEVHLPTDRLGVALRHALADFAAQGARLQTSA